MMWFQRAEANLKYLTHKGNNIVQIVVEEELEHVSCKAATRLVVEFIKPTIAADVFKFVVNIACDCWNQMCCYVS